MGFNSFNYEMYFQDEYLMSHRLKYKPDIDASDFAYKISFSNFFVALVNVGSIAYGLK